MAAVAWLIVLAQHPPSRILAFLCGLLPFIRPELGLLSACLLIRQAYVRLQTARASALRDIAVDAALAFGAAFPFLAWNLSVFGWPLPNTIAAKRAYFANDYNAMQNGRIVVGAILLALGPLPIAFFAAPRSSLKCAFSAFLGLFFLGYRLTLPSALNWVGASISTSCFRFAYGDSVSLWRSRSFLPSASAPLRVGSLQRLRFNFMPFPIPRRRSGTGWRLEIGSARTCRPTPSS